ncbi:MAG TPA: hypothetical protein VGY66_14445 [Gemmataceae bacterium]|nr:hypothetical protein [Gemmataceae bacterium]
MATWAIGLLVACASLLMIFFTYFACQTVFQIEESLTSWARQHGYRIIAKEGRQYFVGPFKINKYRPTYYITVEDRQGQQKKGWIRLGTWYIVGFKERIRVLWEE